MDVKLMRFRQQARVIVSDPREQARSYRSGSCLTDLGKIYEHTRGIAR